MTFYQYGKQLCGNQPNRCITNVVKQTPSYPVTVMSSRCHHDATVMSPYTFIPHHKLTGLRGGTIDPSGCGRGYSKKQNHCRDFIYKNQLCYTTLWNIWFSSMWDGRFRTKANASPEVAARRHLTGGRGNSGGFH